jgi:hypothetical protein
VGGNVCARRWLLRARVQIHATTVVHGSWRNASAALRRTIYYHFDSA